MGIINFSIPKDLVIEIISKVKFENFIETGTYRGATCFWAAKHFNNVYTIEIDPIMSKTTASQPNTPTNIDFLVGNSKDLLKPLVERIKGRSFFWLDGHWCFGDGGKDEECPLLLELEALSKLKDSIILIDDARFFLGPPPPPDDSSNWPLIDDVFEILKKYFPDNFTTIIDDVIVCMPPDVKQVVFDYWIRTFNERYFVPSKGNYNEQKLLKNIPKIVIVKYVISQLVKKFTTFKKKQFSDN